MVCINEDCKTLGLVNDFFISRQFFNNFKHQIDGVSRTWDPKDIWPFHLQQFYRSHIVGSIVGYYLDDILWPNLLNAFVHILKDEFTYMCFIWILFERKKSSTRVRINTCSWCSFFFCLSKHLYNGAPILCPFFMLLQ